MPQGACAQRKLPHLSELLCSTHQAKGGHCFARPALNGGSGATHRWPLTQRVFPRSNPIHSSLKSPTSTSRQNKFPRTWLAAAPHHNPLPRQRGTRRVTQPRGAAGPG